MSDLSQKDFDQIEKYTANQNNTQLHNMITQIKTQHKSWKDYKLIGLLSHSEESQTINKITYRVLTMIDEL